MADLFSLLSTSSAGLGAHRAATQTAQHNIANVNTEGYSRQRASLEANQPAGVYGTSAIGRGVRLDNITRARDIFLERQMGSAFADARQSRAEADTLTSVSALDPDAPGGVPAALSSFFDGLRNLTLNPGDAGARSAALAAAEQVASAFRTTATQLNEARNAVDVQVRAEVDQVNFLAQQVASLNREIRGAAGNGQPPNDLLDARQRAVDELAELTGAKVTATGSGDVLLSLPGGGGLVNGDRAASLTVSPDPANNGHLQVLLQPADGTPPRPLANSQVGGRIGGVLAARDGGLKDALDALDQLAFEFAGAVNTVHAGGIGADSSTGNNLFDVGATVAGAAQSFGVDAAVQGNPQALALATNAAALPGDTSNLEALLTIETTALASGTTAAQGFSQLVTRYGSTTRQALSVADHDEGVLGHLTMMRESVRGVSIDEEMVEMTKAQRAFEALSKVVQTVDEMLEEVIRLKS
jgi:flagellar hook-associated protein 1 FlgK